MGHQFRERLVECFMQIERTRMDGIPILNKVLSVAAFGFEEQGDYRPGVLLTPWFMNLMMVPLNADLLDLQNLKTGSKQRHALPGGDFEFIVGHEGDIGPYLSCSLFSPVFEFTDQKTAEQTAMAVLDQVCRSPGPEEEGGGNDPVDSDADIDMRAIWAGRLPEQHKLTAPLDEVNDKRHGNASRPALELSRRDLLRGFRQDQKPGKQL